MIKRNCVIAYTLNLLDLIFTLILFQFGATELNPLLQSTTFMIFYKTIVVGAILWLLSRQTTNIAIIGVKFILVFYSAVILYHLCCFGYVLLEVT